MADDKDAEFRFEDIVPRSPERIGRIRPKDIERRDFQKDVSSSQSIESELQELSSIHSSDIARRDFVLPKAPPLGHIHEHDSNRDSVDDVSIGKKDGLVPSAAPSVQSAPVAVSAPLAPGSTGGDSAGARSAPGRLRGIYEIGKILQTFGGLVLGCIKTKFCKKICV